MLRDHWRTSKRNLMNNEDLLLPEWAKKDESLKEKFTTEKRKYTRVNPDRLEPILENMMEIKVRSVRNHHSAFATVDRSRKELKSRSSITSEAATKNVDHPMNNAY